jgi:Anti-sigma-K factor rskA
LEAKDIISSGILELYATGIASTEEVKLVQQYVLQYPEVAAELAQIEAGMESYARTFAVQPDPSVKDKIFARINNEENTASKVISLPDNSSQPTAKIIGIRPYWKFATAASVALLFGSIALNVLMYNQRNDTAKNLQRTEQELASLKEENKVMEGDMQVVQSKYSKPVSLHGLEAAPDAAAKIFWMENTGEVYIDPSNLPETPTGMQYQLWAIVDGKPVDGGMILTSKKGDKYRIQKMKTFGKAEAFAVTLETQAGNTTPKGPMFVMGKM